MSCCLGNAYGFCTFLRDEEYNCVDKKIDRAYSMAGYAIINNALVAILSNISAVETSVPLTLLNLVIDAAPFIIGPELLGSMRAFEHLKREFQEEEDSLLERDNPIKKKTLEEYLNEHIQEYDDKIHLKNKIIALTGIAWISTLILEILVDLKNHKFDNLKVMILTQSWDLLVPYLVPTVVAGAVIGESIGEARVYSSEKDRVEEEVIDTNKRLAKVYHK